MQPQYQQQQPYPPQYQQPQPQQAPPQYQAPVPQVPVAPQIVAPQISSGPGPAPAELAGRYVAFIPKSMTTTTQQQNETVNGQKVTKTVTVPAVIADVYVLGSGPYQFGAAPNATPPRPFATHQVMLPALFTERMFSGTNIVRALEGECGTGRAVTGVIVRSEVGGRPWNIDRSAEAEQAAAAFFGAYAAGQVQLQPPVPLAPAPAGYQQPVAPQPPQQQYAPPPPAPQPVYAPQPQQSTGQLGEYPPGYGQMPAQSQPQPFQYPAPGMPAAPQQQYAPPPPVAPQAAQQSLPPGMTPEFWATLSDQQRAMFSQQAAAPAATPANPF